MAKKVEEMKDTLLFGDKKDMLFILDYIKKDLGVEDADYWCYIGYYVISVPYEEYENVLRGVKKYACDIDMGMYWVNHYNSRRSPIGSCDVGICTLPDTLIPGEEEKEYSSRILWDSIDECTPKTILEYLESMRKFLKTDRIFRAYSMGDLIIASLGLDYDTQSKLFKEFVKKYGYGPFKEIRALTYTGEIIEPPILSMKEEVVEEVNKGEALQKRRKRKENVPVDK